MGIHISQIARFSFAWDFFLASFLFCFWSTHSFSFVMRLAAVVGLLSTFSVALASYVHLQSLLRP